ncbi:MAG: hypothetical protein HOK21_06705 [Rhodospirillaceae bacterium]|jgi:hypothetical protein|nr:hypothetical protein [Rhodospirillaceae bacterium]MBT5079758.1 hypothetical protein [Rhodospirillaceae bacterium]MBT5523755.1 hypothetical protein [Rhodospirillaceae bacterium]MBT5881609.1 hypothetical protein [Rhodospirillaceae bacterium]MBT6591460.1 hypothetical protein [Rhodospirillaceae bacterium]
MVTVIFHNLQQAECALAVAAGRPLTLLTAPWAGSYGGPGFYLAIVEAARQRYPQTDVQAILDCGDAAAVAQMALALGWRNLVLRGKASVREKITQIAESYGAEVLSRPPKAFDPGAQATDITVQLRTVF